MSGLERLAFFGTPEFAVPTLDALQRAQRVPISIVSQPPRPAGRGRKPQQPPVARWAERHGIPLVQPAKVRAPEFLEAFAVLEPDVAVVVAFGQIFPRRLLETPAHGCINLHASLLPAYRGAAPIAAVIAAGETVTGVSTMIMEEGLDTGPYLLQRELEIGADETTGELEPRLARLGAELMVETLERLERGELEPVEQDDARASYAPRLTKEDGRLDWSASAATLFCRLRALTPWPGLHTTLRDEPVKVVWGRPLDDGGARPAGEAVAGTFLGVRDGSLAVPCGDGSVFGIERLQRPGKRVVAARDFANGERLEIGECFG